MSDFWIGFIVGGIICGCIVFIVWIICAAAGRGSRMEEKIEKELASRPIIVKVKNHWKPEIEMVTQNNPRTD